MEQGTTSKTNICPICNVSMSSRVFERHVRAEHGDPALIYSTHVLKLRGLKTCECKCGGALTWMGWRLGFTRYVQGHNPPWCKGLRKETDDRVASRGRATSAGKLKAYASGASVAWSKGKTKHDDERLAAYAKRQQKRFASGDAKPWMKGLTRDTDERVARLGNAVRIALADPELRTRLSQRKRLTEASISKRIAAVQHKFELISRDETYDRASTYRIMVRCRLCGNVDTKVLSLLDTWCRSCDRSGSADEASVRDFVRTLGFTPVQTRTVIPPLQLDCYVQEKRFAVELNGLYWHSEFCKSAPDRHEIKTSACKAQGIRLLHVFDDEWRDKRAIVESMIRHRLGASPLRIGARQCEIVELSDVERHEFFERCHIDGDAPRAVSAFGLKHPHHGIVAAMSLRWPFDRKRRARGELEIARWCCALNTSVAGACSKLVAIARCIAVGLGAQALVTYMDRRHGDGRGYLGAGMQHVGTTPPRFWWTDGKRRLGRLTVRADAKRGLSEKQVAEQRGVSRIYCCGNDVYELNLCRITHEEER